MVIIMYPLVNLHNYGKIHHVQWENSLFLWPFSIAMLVITRGYIPLKSPFCWLNPIKPPLNHHFPMVFLWFSYSLPGRVMIMPDGIPDPTWLGQAPDETTPRSGRRAISMTDAGRTVKIRGVQRGGVAINDPE